MDLNERVALLEQRLAAAQRRWRRASVVVIALLGLVVTAGQAAPRQPVEVKAERFLLVDERGRERGFFGMEEGEPMLLFNNSKGTTVVQLFVPKTVDKPAFYLFDRELGTNAELAMTMNGPVLHFNDKSGNRVRLATNELNAPLASIHDAEGNERFKVSAK